MSEPWLLDTGFLIALIDRSDPQHRACAAVFGELRGPLLTVGGVLVEAAHLLRHVRGGPRAAVELVLDEGTVLLEPTAAQLRRALDLMDEYRDVPMDWVDAQLVVAAEEGGVPRALTLDRRGFSTYRVKGRKPFTILPEPE